MKEDSKTDKKHKDSGTRDNIKVTAEDHIKITNIESGKELVNKRG